jgi:chemotaxis protein MotB
MAATRFVTGLAIVALAGAGGAGWYAQREHGAAAAANQRADSLHAQLDSAQADTRVADQRFTACSQARDADNARTAADLDASHAELDQIKNKQADAEKRVAELTEKFRKLIDSGKLQIVMRHGRMIVKLPAEILFSSGSDELSTDGKGALREVAGVLKTMKDKRFMVAGHTDNVPLVPPSPFKNNWELSTSRAVKVLGELVSAGMSPARLSATGYSEYEPVRENSTEAGRRENRRIEIVLLPDLRDLPPVTAQNATTPAPKASAH